MGIALPKWIVESQNNVYVLGFYGLLFGLGLPWLVGRWWFGSRQLTKDGVQAKSAASFFKSMHEGSGVPEALVMLSKGYEFECQPADKAVSELEQLKSTIFFARWFEILTNSGIPGSTSPRPQITPTDDLFKQPW